MTVPDPDQPPPAEQRRERTVEDVLWGRVERRRERIRAQIRRNREGGHKVPTWVLAVILAALLAGWLYLVITS
jgi:hypothetical protein